MRALRGFTLIELAVAVAILSLGSVAAYRSFDQAQRGIGGQIDRALAAEVALNRAAEVRLFGLAEGRALPARVTQGGIDWALSMDEALTAAGGAEVTILVTAPDRPGARYVLAVPR